MMYNEVRRWMYRNARPLDMALWQYHFEGGSPARVADILLCYQNEDGGFGHGLEADCWNPASTPVATWTAVRMLLWCGFTDQTHPVYRGVWRYLASGKDREAYGWRFAVPENDRWPRAPWWTYDEAENRKQHTNVTIPLTAFILAYGQKDTPLFDRACADAQCLAAEMMHRDACGEGLQNMADLLRAMEKHGLPVPCGAQERLAKLVNHAIGRNPADWTGYVPRPSRFIHSKDSPWYAGNEDIVRAEVDFLHKTRTEDGVWPITWTWFDLMEMYGPQFAISENWWKGLVAIENMLFLRAFDKGECNMIDTRCGLRCEGCEYVKSCGCQGCIATNGHPFHGECPVAVCCQEKGCVHCGQCPQIPCELLQQYSCDPVHGDHPAGARIEQCKRWAELDS